MKLPLSELAKKTQDVYERNADRFDAERLKNLYEAVWLDRFLELLPENGSVLDLGCGAADPVGIYMMRQGFRVTGVDASNAMLRLARNHAPEGDWRLADMRRLNLPERFNGIVGWDSFFHLTRDEQRRVLPSLAAHLLSGGVLMLTVGTGDGEVGGHVGEDEVYHSSLSIDEYKSILASAGVAVIHFVREDPDCHFRTVLMARKSGIADQVRQPSA
ncbi:MAG: class I SAM-dependent methyltransferase [Sneathiella sp.]